LTRHDTLGDAPLALGGARLRLRCFDTPAPNGAYIEP
jgi:hypothetical protein